MNKEGASNIDISFAGGSFAADGSAKRRRSFMSIEEGGDLGKPNKKPRLDPREKSLLGIVDNNEGQGSLSPFSKEINNLDTTQGSRTPDTVFSGIVDGFKKDGKLTTRTTPFDDNYQGDTTVFKPKLDDKGEDLFSSLRTEDSSEERENHERFFRNLIDKLGLKKVPNAQFLSVMHMFPDAIPLLGAMESLADIGMIIPKPNSKRMDIVEYLKKKGYPIMHVTRDNIGDVLDHIDLSKRTVGDDIGRWFLPIIGELKEALGDNFGGIIEHTENGYKEYVKPPKPDFPFLSAARSPLKEYGDRKVSENIADATVLVLEEDLGVNIQKLKNGTIGYGKMGRAYSKRMKNKGLDVVVSELKPELKKRAEKDKFETTKTEDILTNRDLIFIANGDKAIKGKQFTTIKNGAFITSVTSREDALDIDWLDNPENGYEKTQHPESEYVTSYKHRENGHTFHLITDGNPINLKAKIPVGNIILLLHSELLVDAYRILTKEAEIGQYEIDDKTRGDILDVWIETFGKEALGEDYNETVEENEKGDDDRAFALSDGDKSGSNIIFQAGL